MTPEPRHPPTVPSYGVAALADLSSSMLASLGPAGRDALIRLMRRNDDVGARFRDGYGVDLDRGKVGYYETCRTQEP